MGATQVAGTLRWRRIGRATHRRATLVGLLAALLTLVVLLAPGLPATAKPLQPAAPLATTTPSASPSASPGGSPPSTPAPPRPDPEGDRWVQLAVVGGGSLLGAVVMFMVIGGIIRGVNRRRYRR